MSDYCRCKDCRHIDPNDKNGYRWYCTWYHGYEDPDAIHECSHFENQSSGGCFLTTACCQYRGLPDDCYELTVLRRFRDGYLLQTDSGKAIVEEYYQIAPALVRKIDCYSSRDAIYENMYTTICEIVQKIEQGKHEDAVSEYQTMVKEIREMV